MAQPTGAHCRALSNTLTLCGKPLPSLNELIGLTELSLIGSVLLKKVPPTIYQLTALKTLCLAHTRITKLDEPISRLQNLTSLDLSATKLTTLPDSIGDLSSLTDLDMHNSDLVSLPESIGRLTNLVSLHLNNTSLSSVPPTIGNCHCLENLDLSQTPLKSLPGEIGKLCSLKSLIAGACYNLTGLPHTISHLTSLTELNLVYSSRCETPQIQNLKSLTNFTPPC